MIIQRFNLNLIPNQSPVIVHVNQYDTGTGRLIATLYEGNEPYSPSGTAVIQGTKPDGHGFQYTATLDGNVVTADLTEQMSPVAGDVRAQIVVTESSGVTGTFVFIMRVQPSALPSDADMSESDYPLIEEAIREAQEAVQTAQEAVERAQEAITETQENAENSEAWAQGTRGGIPVEPTDPTYEHNAEYWAQYAERYAQGGLHYKGSIPFANIPTTGMREGDMYDITDDFTTDSRFTEGAGIKVKGGTNIAWNSDNKWDILALPYIPKTTFNGRSGSILPMAGDYDSKKILLTSALHIGGETQSDVQEALEALSNDGVKSFNGRSGSILPVAGDYDSEKILLASVLHIGGEMQENAQEALEALENNKADRVDGAIADNFAGLDANGNLKDSGKNADDFATPSDIESVEVMYEEEIHGVNLFNNAQSISGNNAYGLATATSNGIKVTNSTASAWSNVSYNLRLKKNTTYRYSFNTTITSGNSGILIRGSLDGGATFTTIEDSGDGVSNYDDTFNSGSYDIIRLTFYCTRGTSTTGSVTYNNVMLRKADIEDSTYCPYNPQAIQNQLNAQGVLGAKNLLLNNVTSRTTNGVTFTVNSDGSVTVNGTADPTATGNAWYPYYIGKMPAGKYLLNGCPTGGQETNGYFLFFRKDPDNASFRYYDTGNGVSIDIPNDDSTFICFICIWKGVTVNNLIFYPMLRLASDPDDTYQPYAMTNRELTEEKINIADLKTVVSASSDFADFKTRIASL